MRSASRSLIVLAPDRWFLHILPSLFSYAPFSYALDMEHMFWYNIRTVLTHACVARALEPLRSRQYVHSLSDARDRERQFSST
jgi:hypothetical protein